MGTVENIAVFIDADNLNDATALDHVLTEIRSMGDRVVYKRAYGRAESLKSLEAVLWRHGVRPVANLVVDKVTTDGALVIDAVEAVCTNDIDLVVICSGDADFVPLAMWLREKTCRVVCFSLAHKIFANPESFYDEVVLLNVVAGPTDKSVTHTPSLSSGDDRSAPPAEASVVSTAMHSKVSVKAILKALPGLRSGHPVHLSQAAQALRQAGLLAQSAASTKLFRVYPAQFELMPKHQPNTVRYRG